MMTSTADQHDHHRPQLRSIPRLAVQALRHLWASDVNIAAIELLAPNPGEHVVDIGAGFGPATGPLVDRVGPSGTVTAIEPSRVMRIVLGARTRATRRTAVAIRNGTAECLPLPDESVDRIVSLNAMHHLADLEQAATEFQRVLRPNGKILLIDEDFDHPDHSLHQPDQQFHHGLVAIDPHAVAGLLTNAGFTNVAPRRDTIGSEPALVIAADR